MVGRLKLIEQQLIGIDSAAFQNLCDIYLDLREKEFTSFNRIGSQLGKQKTTKGTPDTFYRLSDGTLRYVEYTTKSDNVVSKIKEDIDKCLDETKTGISRNEIHSIIICFNSRLEVKEETELVQYAKDNKIKITLIGLDLLSLEIYSKYIILAKDILGLPIDTGQVLPISNFVDEYNNKGGKLSTPIDNIFLNRDKELELAEDCLTNLDFLIVSGVPGVGKTKFALEVIYQFLKLNQDYTAFGIAKKDVDIWEDLRIHLDNEHNYILLIDDANRQLPNFKQILGILKEDRKGKIKIIITVRDYAYSDIIKECYELNPEKITLNKFSDEEIIQLISSKSFEILNHKYQKRIVHLTDGNARLAIMCCRLAKEKQWEFLQGDITDLYDTYFQTFIRDFDVFSNKTLFKTLGIISFFYTIDRNDKQLIENILLDFEIDYYEFQEALEDLHKKELVEIQYDHVKVSEQIMSTYFFYKSLIKEKVLSFRTLLSNYFNNWKYRFNDTIIPANNSFGYDNVLSQISTDLDFYLNSIYNHEESVLDFLKIFWFYKREETLNYFYNQVKELPEPVNPSYNTFYNTNDFVFDKDTILSYLKDFFNFNSESYLPALELSFEYARKKPDALPELIRRIKERIFFCDEDNIYEFQRQVDLFNLLIKKFNEHEVHYIEAFFTLSESFLKHTFQVFGSGRKHTITFYQYKLPFNDTIKAFRGNVFTTLIDNYTLYPDKIFKTFKEYRPIRGDIVNDILEFDLIYIVRFIEECLDKENFSHVYFVQDLICWLNKEKITNTDYKRLKDVFVNDEYRVFRKLDWNLYRGKRDFDYENYEEFQKLKEKEIRQFFTFVDNSRYQELFTAIKNILSIGENDTWGLTQALNIIFEENFILNEDIGYDLVVNFLNNYPIGIYPLGKFINLITSSDKYCLKFWELLKAWDNDSKLYWQLTFLESLPVKNINEFYVEELLLLIKSIHRRCYFGFDMLNKFETIKPDISLTILTIVLDKNENQKIEVSLPYFFFEKYTDKFKNEINLICRLYVCEMSRDKHFDHDKKDLKEIVKIKPQFLIDYVTILYGHEKYSYQSNDDNLSFVWDSMEVELIKILIGIVVQNNPYYSGEHILSIFFKHLKDDRKLKAESFITEYIKENSKDIGEMNIIFDVVRHQIKDKFEYFMLLYLQYNVSIDDFKKIWWRGNGGGVYHGDVNFGELELADWQNIYSIVEKFTDQLSMIPIKNYIKKKIEYSIYRAEQERKDKYIRPF